MYIFLCSCFIVLLFYFYRELLCFFILVFPGLWSRNPVLLLSVLNNHYLHIWIVFVYPWLPLNFPLNDNKSKIRKNVPLCQNVKYVFCVGLIYYFLKTWCLHHNTNLHVVMAAILKPAEHCIIYNIILCTFHQDSAQNVSYLCRLCWLEFKAQFTGFDRCLSACFCKNVTICYSV